MVTAEVAPKSTSGLSSYLCDVFSYGFGVKLKKKEKIYWRKGNKYYSNTEAIVISN